MNKKAIYESIHEVPHINSLKKSWKLFYPNMGKILIGSSLYILAHPISSWRILYARLTCIFCPYLYTLKTPEGFKIKGWWQIYVYAQLFIEKTLFHRKMIKDFGKQYKPIVIDVGANIGMFSQWLGQYNKNAIFYSFEPLKEHYEEHKRILKESFRDVVLENKAISNYNGYGYLSITDRVALDKERGNPVRVVTLDEYYNDHKSFIHLPIFLLKIDTDGSNLKVLEGTKAILNACHYILIEKEDDYSEYFKGWKCYDLGADYLYEQVKLYI